MRSNTIIFTLLCLFLASFVCAQGTMRGHVYDQNTGDPIIYANVILENTDIGGTTDLDGFFSVSNIPEGQYTLNVTYLGYDIYKQEISIDNGKILNQQIYLTQTGVNLGVIDISAQREVAKTEVNISKLQVSKKQIKALPSTGGEPDIIQYLQILPGVISTGDQGGQIFIRGGSPVQNKIMMDGLTIYNPFHSIGFFSVFETELIKNVEVLTGGFNAENGGRISAVVDIKTREGNRSRLAGQLSASPFMAKGLLEIPIIKLDEDKGTSGSLVITGKKSYIDQTSKSLYSYASASDSIGLPFAFTDLYSKMSFVTSNGSKFNLFGFNYDDQYNDPAIAKIGWNSSGGGMNFTLLPASSSLILNGIIGFSNYETSIEEENDNARRSLIREYLLGLNFDYFGNNYDIKYGLEIKSIRTEFDFFNPFGVPLAQNQNTTELAGFLKYRQVFKDRLIVEPSLRLQYYASLSEFSLEPRLGIKYNISDRLRFKFAGGIYSQNLIAASNERDVVNLFTGFLSGPEESFNDLDGNRVSSKLQKSRHLVGGFEFDLTKNLQVNVEGYLKDYPQLIIVNRNRTDVSQPKYATETGEAYGIDFSAKYEKPSWYIWATYSYGFVNRFDGVQTYPTVFDRRHTANFLATYSFGEQKDWQLSLRYNLGSGFPFTRTQGFYNYLPFQDGVGTDYITENPDNIGIIYSEDRNGGRLPYYHRVDLSAQKTIQLSKNANLEIVFSVTNAADRNNIFYFDRVEYDRVDQLPIIPSLAARFNF